MLVTDKRRAAFAVGSLVARNVYVAMNPAEFDGFASIDEICIAFGNFEYQIQFNFKIIEGFERLYQEVACTKDDDLTSWCLNISGAMTSDSGLVNINTALSPHRIRDSY